MMTHESDSDFSLVQIVTSASVDFHIGIDLLIASICLLMFDVLSKVECLPFVAFATSIGSHLNFRGSPTELPQVHS